MSISPSTFLWQEPDKTITVISLPEIPIILEPSYKVGICVKTMQGEHPEGLLKLLQERGFKSIQHQS